MDLVAFNDAARAFSAAVARKFAAGGGQPEALIRGPLETFVTTAGTLSGVQVIMSDEHALSAIDSRPDWSVTVDGALVGFIEAKAPGRGANTQQFRGRDRDQWSRLCELPNLLYTDGNQFALYRYGVQVASVQQLSSDVRNEESTPVDARGMAELLEAFLSWEPHPPGSLDELAATSARLCRLLRAEVRDNLGGSGPLRRLANEWRELLYPEATDETFADQYAQTVTFSLLLARAEQIDVAAPLWQVARVLSQQHGLLGKALELLTDDRLLRQLSTSLISMQRVIGAVEWDRLVDRESRRTVTGRVSSPWLHFYEDFLAAYDPVLRRLTGSYYTPDEVVEVTVTLVEEALRQHLGLSLGLAADDVTVVDPAAGTGTYLLSVVEHFAETVTRDRGEPAVAGRLNQFASRLIGFELQAGPFAVTQMRLAAAMREYGADPEHMRVYVADTLDNPYVETASFGAAYEPIAQSRRQANLVKAEERVLVILGNPPYRDDAQGEGGWVEAGNINVAAPGTVEPSAGVRSLLDDFRADPALGLGRYEHLLNNLHVFFWRWALWKAFEAHHDAQMGVVAFISPAAWLTVRGLTGMRSYMRHLVDRIYVIDLGGEGRGGRQDDNVFAIQTPVAITIAVRDGSNSESASVHYRKVTGSREEKLAALREISSLEEGWTAVTGDPEDPVTSALTPEWVRHPLLRDLLPWSPPGVKPNRTWVYSPDADVLRRRWSALIAESDPEAKRVLARETPSTYIDRPKRPLAGYPTRPALLRETEAPDLIRVGRRSFDRQWLISDARVIHRPSPDLWRVAGEHQVYLLHNQADAAGVGPATTFHSFITDQGAFNGRNDVTTPLWRDATGHVANVLPGLAALLSDRLGQPVSDVDVYCYVAGVTSHGGYTSRFWEELELPGLRVPLTANCELWKEAVDLGQTVIWLHTYGERFADPEAGRPSGHVRLEDGGPRVLVGIPSDPDRHPEALTYEAEERHLHVGEGRIGPVSADVAGYEVAGMNIVEKWFGYRKRVPSGRRSSPLDDINVTGWPPGWTDDLLDLLHVLGRVVELEARQGKLLDAILRGPLVTVESLTAAALLPVPDSARAPAEDEAAPIPPRQLTLE